MPRDWTKTSPRYPDRCPAGHNGFRPACPKCRERLVELREQRRMNQERLSSANAVPPPPRPPESRPGAK